MAKITHKLKTKYDPGICGLLPGLYHSVRSDLTRFLLSTLLTGSTIHSRPLMQITPRMMTRNVQGKGVVFIKREGIKPIHADTVPMINPEASISRYSAATSCKTNLFVKPMARYKAISDSRSRMVLKTTIPSPMVPIKTPSPPNSINTERYVFSTELNWASRSDAGVTTMPKSWKIYSSLSAIAFCCLKSRQ